MTDYETLAQRCNCTFNSCQHVHVDLTTKQRSGTRHAELSQCDQVAIPGAQSLPSSKHRDVVGSISNRQRSSAQSLSGSRGLSRCVDRALTLKWLDSTFDLKEHGYGAFSEILKAMNSLVEVKMGDRDHLLRLR